MENFSRLLLPAETGISDGKTTHRLMSRFLPAQINLERLGQVPLLAVNAREIRLEIDIIGINLHRALRLNRRLVKAIIREVDQDRHCANDGRERIETDGGLDFLQPLSPVPFRCLPETHEEVRCR